jgi:hypothetical protein
MSAIPIKVVVFLDEVRIRSEQVRLFSDKSQAWVIAENPTQAFFILSPPTHSVLFSQVQFLTDVGQKAQLYLGFS